MVIKVPVKYADQGVDLLLDVPDVERSIELKGVGDTATCSMAVCVTRHAPVFDRHGVTGDVDWTYTRAAIVSKTDKEGMPSECVVYGHNSDIAKYQDNAAGQQRLLALLQQDGPMHIRLLPLKGKKARAAKKRRKADGIVPRRPKRPSEPGKRLRGAKLRYATAMRGLSPEEEASLSLPRQSK